jgi:hypothetical protein
MLALIYLLVSVIRVIIETIIIVIKHNLSIKKFKEQEKKENED